MLHVANGDALAEVLPHLAIEPANIAVMRECLCTGPVEPLPRLWSVRAKYIAASFETTEHDYLVNIADVRALPDSDAAEIALWFEDDLFCQINLWCVCCLLENHSGDCSLVRPDHEGWRGFADMNAQRLHDAFERRLPLPRRARERFADMWRAFVAGDMTALTKGAMQCPEIPRLPAVVAAELARRDGHLAQRLTAIVKRHGADDFAAIFRDFSASEGIYGFGDAQVKLMLETLT